jgi:hypothetical protein
MMPSPSSPSSSIDSTSCPHGPRAGTTTCLYCRNEARALARQKRNRLLARVGLFAMGGATAIALIVGAIISIVPAGGAGVGATTTAEVVPSAPAPEQPAFVLEPTVPEGSSALGDSITAERNGGDVIVYFDTEALRTRFDWKFEGVVRATLPKIFGTDARVALDSVRTGDFVRGGHLIRDLPTKGIPLALSDGRSLIIRPITRPGLDGPLVVGYRASAVRN